MIIFTIQEFLSRATYVFLCLPKLNDEKYTLFSTTHAVYVTWGNQKRSLKNVPITLCALFHQFFLIIQQTQTNHILSTSYIRVLNAC